MDDTDLLYVESQVVYGRKREIYAHFDLPMYMFPNIFALLLLYVFCFFVFLINSWIWILLMLIFILFSAIYDLLILLPY